MEADAATLGAQPEDEADDGCAGRGCATESKRVTNKRGRFGFKPGPECGVQRSSRLEQGRVALELVSVSDGARLLRDEAAKAILAAWCTQGDVVTAELEFDSAPSVVSTARWVQESGETLGLTEAGSPDGYGPGRCAMKLANHRSSPVGGYLLCNSNAAGARFQPVDGRFRRGCDKYCAASRTLNAGRRGGAMMATDRAMCAEVRSRQRQRRMWWLR